MSTSSEPAGDRGKVWHASQVICAAALVLMLLQRNSSQQTFLMAQIAGVGFSKFAMWKSLYTNSDSKKLRLMPIQS